MSAWRSAAGRISVLAIRFTPCISSNEDYVARYCERTGRDGVDNWPFYLAYSIFRACGIMQGVKKRMLSGNASSADGKALAFDVESVVKKMETDHDFRKWQR